MKRLCVLGCGVMGQAIIRGIVQSGLVAREDIIVTTRRLESARRVMDSLGVEATTDNRSAAAQSAMVLIALKPQILDSVVKDFRESVRLDALIISIAAGKTIQKLEEYFSQGHKIIRAMPNIQALTLEGMSVLCGNQKITPDDMEEALRIFRTFGEAEEIPERLMDVAMALTSCSPAYVGLFVEALADAGVKMGMARQQALVMVEQAVYGAVKLLKEKDLHPAILKDMVCSPGGTTIEGVAALEDRGFRGTVIHAVEAAVCKAKKL